MRVAVVLSLLAWAATAADEPDGNRRELYYVDDRRCTWHVTGPALRCHPRDARLRTCDGADVRVDAVRVGDEIATPAGCEPITGFLHRDAAAVAEYHVIRTKGGRTLAIAPRHWMWVNGADADPASVRAGDVLRTAEGDEDVVANVALETRRGAYHPMVPSGAYFVDGLRASTYVADVPRWAFSLFADRYVAWRHRMGVPVTPEGEGPLATFWPQRLYGAAGISPDAASAWLWPLTVAGIAASEALNAPLAYASARWGAAAPKDTA
jgi:hypothetical protein